MRKRALTLLLAGTLAVGGFAGCSDEDNDGNPEVDLPDESDVDLDPGAGTGLPSPDTTG